MFTWGWFLLLQAAVAIAAAFGRRMSGWLPFCMVLIRNPLSLLQYNENRDVMYPKVKGNREGE